MRIATRARRTEQGNVVFVCLILAGIVGYLLASYLTLVEGQHLATARSQSWNVCVPVLEAGIEEALTHLQYCTSTNLVATVTNLSSDGWALDSTGTNYFKARDLGDGCSYVARISTTLPPIITSTGTAPIPLSGTNLSRTVQCTTQRNALFAKGMVAKGQIDLNGNNIATDSFDSADPNYSTNGVYWPGHTKSNGDIATDSGLTNSLSVGNATIQGHVSSGPGQNTIEVGPNGSVGSAAWIQGGNTGIQPGWSNDDMNVAFPDVQAPFSSGYSTPAGGSVGGTNYTYVMGSGNYELSTLSLSGQNQVLINGNAVLYVTGNVSLAGNAQLIIATNASLMLYVGTANTNAPVSVSLGGNGIANQGGNAANFYYFGLPSNTSLSLSGNATFTGAIYAPEAAFTLGGGGSGTYNFVGGSVSATATMNGHYNFHYDENLARVGPARGYVVTSWNETFTYNEI
ncbi:MAG: hypothetical protein KGS61_11335 [Verrucomicrobia bacterium]|nr:hypothetical protein [Verrucomicrobiota bacterium]